MAKKFTFAPGILLTIPDPSPTTVVGGGTGQSTPDDVVVACSFDHWMSEYAIDSDNDGDIDFDDYRKWFKESFPDEWDDLWGMFNDVSITPGDPFP